MAHRCLIASQSSPVSLNTLIFLAIVNSLGQVCVFIYLFLFYNLHTSRPTQNKLLLVRLICHFDDNLLHVGFLSVWAALNCSLESPAAVSFWKRFYIAKKNKYETLEAESFLMTFILPTLVS